MNPYPQGGQHHSTRSASSAIVYARAFLSTPLGRTALLPLPPADSARPSAPTRDAVRANPGRPPAKNACEFAEVGKIGKLVSFDDDVIVAEAVKFAEGDTHKSQNREQ